MARKEGSPASLSRTASSITFLYPLLNLWCFPPRPSINDVKPFDVTESVTMVVPGCSSNTMAPARAMSLLRLISSPDASTAPARSTSVSKMMPRSALLSRVAWRADCIASWSSGLGMWFGNMPSGSRNWLPDVSAPRGCSTLSTKKPPHPLPASTITRRPSRGLSPCCAPERMDSTRSSAYAESRSLVVTEPTEGATLASSKVAELATSRILEMSSFARPPQGRKNLRPFLSKGKWLAVIITPASVPKPGRHVLLNMAGVVANPTCTTLHPAAVSPSTKALLTRSPEILESRPTATVKTFLLAPSGCFASNLSLMSAAKPNPMRQRRSSVRVTGLPPGDATA
mmetsp:Transcript_8716/g.20388  ORF Transcript_8716/g.20388 Transcript_8716/m.20388 type:complete len:342 (+) Transcript_8716:777-1802(+)